jgi:hypothetical protein
LVGRFFVPNGSGTLLWGGAGGDRPAGEHERKTHDLKGSHVGNH